MRIGGVRINPDGTGVVWRGKTPNPDDRIERLRKNGASDLATTRTCCLYAGRFRSAIVSQHIGEWRNEAIISLAGPEAERLAFGLRWCRRRIPISCPRKRSLAAARLSRAGANLLLDHCKAEARAILQMRWPAVEAIARALDLEDELDGEAVARLMAQHPPLR